MKRINRIVALAGAVALAILPTSTGAFAAEDQPSPNPVVDRFKNHDDGQIVPLTKDTGSASFGNGVTLNSHAWIQPLSDWSGCGQFKTSVFMNRSPKWIRNATSFYQIGFGSLNIKGVSIESSRSGSNTLVWTNSNGAKGSYLSGSVCGGWGAVYVGMDVTGTAFYNGTTRVASAHI